MLDIEKTILSAKIRERIDRLHSDKIQINQEKIRHLGHLDIDDHGFIDFPDFQFQPITREDGMVYGMELLGQNFRKILNEMPVYCNPASALATCWPGNLSRWMEIGLREENRPKHLYPVHEKYNILQHGCGGMNHLCPDLTIGLELGWKGLLEKVRFYKEKNVHGNPAFYEGEEQLLLGVLEWIGRHVEAAGKMAEEAESEELRAHYAQVTDCNAWLLENPPRTLRQACQFTAHFQCIDRMYYAGGALGQMDELFRPYYERDREKLGLTDEEAVWYFASLFFNDTHYSQIGGLTPSGDAELTSRVSFLILDAVHYLKIPSNVGIRVHDGIDGTLLRRSLEYNMEDGTGVCYSCSQGCEEGFARNGFPRELARMRVKCGCNWTAIPGVEYPLQDVTRISMPMALCHAMEEMKGMEQPGTEKLWELFAGHLKVMVDCVKEGYDWHYEHVSQDTPEIVLNLFMHGPIERGLNCAQGGVDIMDLNIDGIGLATVADSFAAMEQRIETERALTYPELYTALEADYQGYERIRLMLKNIDRLGAPHSPSMKWAERIRNLFVDLCMEEPTPKHHLKVVAGMFSHGDIVRYGEALPATPNGRKAGEPISHSNEPDPGFASGLHTFAPSLKANTVARLQPGYGNSSPLHLDVDSSMITKEGGVEALETLIHAHNHMGGTLINLNCLTKERLLKAHADPASDPDLVVRVTGYSAFFSSLSPKYRQQIVDRFLA